MTAQKIENRTFDALTEIKAIDKNELLGMRSGITNFTYALNHFNWGLNNDEYPNFNTLGYEVSELNISDYQSYCLIKLADLLVDARVLYENNLISFGELREIVSRIKKDTYKRFTSIQKSNAKKKLKSRNLDADSLLILKAKLAILENEN